MAAKRSSGFCYPVTAALFCGISVVTASAFDSDEMARGANELEDKDGRRLIVGKNQHADGYGADIRHEGGSGMYRDPLEILGNRFRSSVTTNLCASELLMAADQVTKVRFTYKGAKLCDDVCAQYMQTMRTEGEVEVDLMRSYCDFTGSTYATAGEYDLSSTCTCGYKVRCNQRTKMVAYAFRPNPRGFLKVSVTKFSDTKDIT